MDWENLNISHKRRWVSIYAIYPVQRCYLYALLPALYCSRNFDLVDNTDVHITLAWFLLL